MGQVKSIILIIILLYLLSKYWENVCTKNVSIKIYFDKLRVIEGDECTLITEVTNKKIMPLPIIKFKIKIPIQLEKKDYYKKETIMKDRYEYIFITSLISFQKFKRRTIFIPEKRGFYQIENVSVELIDLLGISKSRLEYNDNLKLIVHPKTDNVDKLFMNNNSYQGKEIVRRWILPDPIIYSGVRQYNIRDSYKDIDWKATAKLGELYVKKYDYTSDPSVVFLIDVNIENNGSICENEYVDKAVRITASMVKELANINIPVGLATNAFVKYLDRDTIMPDIGKKHYMKIFDLLACLCSYKMKEIENTAIKTIRSCHENNCFIFIVYEITDSMYKFILNISNYSKVKVIEYKKSNVSFSNKEIDILNI